MRYRSKALAAEERAAAPIRRQFLADNPDCQRCGKPATEVDEKKLRSRGGSISDTRNFNAFCRDCHRWKTEHPTLATEQGWTVHSWDR